MKQIWSLIALSLVSSLAWADDFKITPGVESYQMTSKDLLNDGTLTLKSAVNTSMQVKYNWKITKKAKISLLYKGEGVYLGENFINKKFDYLNTFQVGQHFYSKKNDYSYHIGATERVYITSSNNLLSAEKMLMPIITFGFNHAIFELDEHIIGFDAKASYFNALARKINGTAVYDGASGLAGLTVSRYYKSFYYRIYVQAGGDYQRSEATQDNITRTYLGLDFNFKF